MARITEHVLYTVEDLAYGMADLVCYLVWRLRDAMARDQRVELAVWLVAALAFLAAICVAGTMDYADDQAQLALWAERGITVARW